MDRIVGPNLGEGEERKEEEKIYEEKVRPQLLKDFVGNDSIKKVLQILIDSAKKNNEAVEHLLFSGPPGTGKTTLANIMANEMGVEIFTTSGPTLDRASALSILTKLKKGSIFFIDEIHRLRHIIEEILYPAMEDFEINIIIGEGKEAATVKLPIEKFCLIGATTKSGLLEEPFRNRFGYSARLELYDWKDLQKIIKRSAKILRMNIDEKPLTEIAKRSRGTPRIANRLLRLIRHYATAKGIDVIKLENALDALEIIGVDKLGLNHVDKKILDVICKDFGGGPVGLKTISVSVGEDIRTIEDVYEPFLIHLGFLKRTAQGREATPAAFEHMRIKKENKKFIKVDKKKL